MNLKVQLKEKDQLFWHESDTEIELELRSAVAGIVSYQILRKARRQKL